MAFLDENGLSKLWGKVVSKIETLITRYDSETVQPLKNARDEEISELTKSLTGSISAEAKTRKEADAALSQAISNEATAREDADAALSKVIDNETKAREDADTALTKSISDEAKAREDADAALTKMISDETNARDKAVQGVSDTLTALGLAVVDGTLCCVYKED